MESRHEFEMNGSQMGKQLAAIRDVLGSVFKCSAGSLCRLSANVENSPPLITRCAAV
jgi:hypothetical protein